MEKFQTADDEEEYIYIDKDGNTLVIIDFKLFADPFESPIPMRINSK
jgi:hypothetical protein